MSDYRTGSVTSADGTVVGYRRQGSGPAVVLMHGGMQAAQNLMKLAGALADEFTVVVPDRRGRGLSGPHGDNYGIEREVEDVQALVAATGAERIFGLSAGGLVSLRSALAIPQLRQVAVYEPPLSVHGSVPTDWVERYDREVAAGKPAAALVTSLRGLGVEPVLSKIPRFVLAPLMPLALRLQRNVPSGDVAIETLVPTLRFDLRLVEQMADTAKDYATLRAQVLLMNGAKSPAYYGITLDELSAAMPQAQRTTFPGLSHSSPDDDGDPGQVAERLRAFFATSG